MLKLDLGHLRPSASHVVVTLSDVRIPASNPKQTALHVAYCGKGSKFWNASMKWKALGDPDAANKRAADAFARLGVVGWENVDGAAFSVDGVIEIFDALMAADRFDKIDHALLQALNPDNFTEPAPVEAGELGKP